MFAWLLGHIMGPYERAVAPVKTRLFADLLRDLQAPKILDIGVGAGPNLKYLTCLPAGSQVVGLDPNPAMEPYCQKSAAACGLQDSFTFVIGDAQAMPFPSAVFDAAVITLVLCSVPDVSTALTEVKRVVKPGGHVLLVEHVISPQPGWMRTLQYFFEPLHKWIADGCHLTRDTVGALRTAGFGGVDGLWRFRVGGMGLCAPQVAGLLEV